MNPFIPPSYGLNFTTNILLQGWPRNLKKPTKFNMILNQETEMFENLFFLISIFIKIIWFFFT